MLKNGASNRSMRSRKPPLSVVIFPRSSGPSARNAGTSHRSSGIVRMPERPSRKKSSNSSADWEPPGRRSPIPMTAIGSPPDGSGCRMVFRSRDIARLSVCLRNRQGIGQVVHELLDRRPAEQDGGVDLEVQLVLQVRPQLAEPQRGQAQVEIALVERQLFAVLDQKEPFNAGYDKVFECVAAFLSAHFTQVST